MYFEINIALNGSHLFATNERSIQDALTLMQVAKILNEKFPETEGYSLSVSYYPESGYSTNRAPLMEAISTNEIGTVYALFEMNDSE